jgi:transcriptional regulator GlxA family with amidase domain
VFLKTESELLRSRAPQGAPVSPLLANIYLRMRLEKARQLLRQTDMSVLEVSIARV